MLLYLSTNTRPDISFAVSQVCRFGADPKQSHASAVKTLLRYLKGTADKGMLIRPTKGLVGTSSQECSGILKGRGIPLKNGAKNVPEQFARAQETQRKAKRIPPQEVRAHPIYIYAILDDLK